MTDTITLTDYATKEIDIETFPHAYPSAPESFYTRLQNESQDFVNTLAATMPTTLRSRDGNEYTAFDFPSASGTAYYNAIEREPRLVLQGLTFTCHLTERLVREMAEVDAVFQYASSPQPLRQYEGIQTFVTTCRNTLTEPILAETVAFMYFRTQEQNRIQHARGAFYESVHDYMEQEGFSIARDQSAPGRPNVIVTKQAKPEMSSKAIAGKAIRAKPNDVPKRARQAGSRIEEMKKEYPGVTGVVLLDIENHTFPNSRVREKQRRRVQRQHESAIDNVFFADELGEFADYCDTVIPSLASAEMPGDSARSDASLDAWKADPRN